MPSSWITITRRSPLAVSIWNLRPTPGRAASRIVDIIFMDSFLVSESGGLAQVGTSGRPVRAAETLLHSRMVCYVLAVRTRKAERGRRDAQRTEQQDLCWNRSLGPQTTRERRVEFAPGQGRPDPKAGVCCVSGFARERRAVRSAGAKSFRSCCLQKDRRSAWLLKRGTE